MWNLVYTSFDELPVQWDKTTMSYYVYQRESCPETKRLHWHGYIELIKRTRFTTLKKKYPMIHIEKRRGSQSSAIKYCSKPDTRVEGPYEFGQPKVQGKRNDLSVAKELAVSGGSVRTFIDEADRPNYQSIRTMEKLLEYKEPVRDFKPVVFWLYGRTGVGKTKIATFISQYLGDVWYSDKSLKWWQGYDGHETVIIDDFRKDFCTYHELLRILDRYPYRVEFKGGARQLRAKYMFITSPYSPEETYEIREDIGQLIRRINLRICIP